MQKKHKEYDHDEMGDPDIKLIIIGDTAAGKSKLVERYLFDDYEQRNMSTYGLTMYRKVIDIEDKKTRIDIWDTAGQEQYNTMHPSYYFGAAVAILVFDITRKVTYENLRKWYVEMRKYCPQIPCILIGNKIDIKPEVTNKKFAFANKHKQPFYFTSAAEGTNVVKCFREALNLAMEYKANPPDSYLEDVLELLNDDDLANFQENI